MDLATFKMLSALFLFLLATIGGLAALKLERSETPVVMHLAFAFAAGILIAVAEVHMLSDGASDLEDAGILFSRTFNTSGNCVFPLGNMLFVFGFALITIIEELSRIIFGDHHHHDILPLDCHKKSMDCHKRSSACVVGSGGGLAALLGLSFHSIIEGVAAGSGRSKSTTAFILIAVAIHKGFSAFALAAANISLVRQERTDLWILLVFWFALSGTIGILIGMYASMHLEDTVIGAITCVAGGSLLSVGMTELLLPAIKNEDHLVCKLSLFTFSLSSMSLLAVWA